MLALWFVLGAVSGAFFSMIVMALLFVAKESDEDAAASTERRPEKLALRDTVHAA